MNAAQTYWVNLCQANEQRFVEELNQLRRELKELGYRADMSNPNSELCQRQRVVFAELAVEIRQIFETYCK